MGCLDGRVALVVGAGSIGPGWGNGKAAAVLFAREGAQVVCCDLNRDAAEETATLIRSEGGNAIALSADVTRESDVKTLIDETREQAGTINILHNNVGTLEVGGPEEVTLESWERVMKINVTSMFLTCKYALPIMTANKNASIINVSSIVAITSVGPHYISYSASKAAVNQFTRSLAIQYASRGLRVNAIMPGLMRTPMVEKTLGKAMTNAEVEAMMKSREAICPLGRMGDAWDVAKTALFLASDNSDYITGQIITVDGGLTLQSAKF